MRKLRKILFRGVMFQGKELVGVKPGGVNLTGMRVIAGRSVWFKSSGY